MKRIASIVLTLCTAVLSGFAQDITIPDITTAVPGEVKNDYGIIMTPGEGQEKTYQRGGKRFEITDEVNSTVKAGFDQSGLIYTVECDGGVVYMQRPVQKYGAGKGYASRAWIRGERQGDNLVFPAGQPVNMVQTYDENWDFMEIRTIVCLDNEINGGTWFEANLDLPIVFHEGSDGTLTLTTETDHDLLGIFWEDDLDWAGYGDYRTVHTFYGDGHLYEAAQPSWKLKQQNYVLSGFDVAEGLKNYNARLAFDDATGEVFLGNFCAWTQYKYDADDEIIWIKGRRNADGSLYFPMEQYLFEYNSFDSDEPLFFYGIEQKGTGIYTIRDLTFVPAGEEGHYKAAYGLAVIKGIVSTSMNRYEVMTDLTLAPAADGDRPFIITEQPEGDLFTYTRSGVAFGFDDHSAPGMGPQSGTIDIVFSKDRKYVYLHNPIAEMQNDGADSWVSGTLITYKGRPTLAIPMQQYLDWSDKYGYGQKLAAFQPRTADPGSKPYEMVLNLVTMTYTIDVETGVITLDRLSDFYDYSGYDGGTATPPLILGSAYSDDNGWTYYGDFDSVYTPTFNWNAEEFFLTAINQIDYNPAPGTYYDLSGRRTRNANGLRIENGRTVLR